MRRYEIVLRDAASGNIKAIYGPSEYIDLKFSVKLNEISKFALTLRDNENTRGLWQLDDIVQIIGTPLSGASGESVVYETYLLTLLNPYDEENVAYIAWGGLSLLSLIKRRIIIPTADDVQNAGGFVTRAGEATEVIKGLLDENMGAGADASRNPLPGFTATAQGGGQSVGIRTRYKNLWEAVQELREAGEVDFSTVYNPVNGDIEIVIGQVGSDKRYDTLAPTEAGVLLEPGRGDLIDPSITLDHKKEVNAVSVLGEGEGSNQTVFTQVSPSAKDSIFNQREAAYEVRRGNDESTSETTRLTTRAVAELNKGEPKVNFEYTLDVRNTQTGIGVDYGFGDVVQVSWRGVDRDMRLTGYEITVGQGEPPQIEVKLKEYTYGA